MWKIGDRLRFAKNNVNFQWLCCVYFNLALDAVPMPDLSCGFLLKLSPLDSRRREFARLAPSVHA